MSNEVAVPSRQGPSEIGLAAPPPADAPPSTLVTWAYEARQAQLIATALSESSFVPASLRNKPQDVTVALLAGHEMGLQPMATLRSIDIIQGSPSLRAHAMRGLLQAHGHSIQLVEATDDRVVMRGRRKGESEWQEVEWTFDRAQRLGVTSKDQWRKQPRTMLIARATGEVCRLIASDVIHAMPYTSEEAYDDTPPPPTRARVTPDALRAQSTPAPEVAAEAATPAAAPGDDDSPAGAGADVPPDGPDETPASASGPPSGGTSNEPTGKRPSSQKQRARLKILAGELGLNDPEQRTRYEQLLTDVACRPVSSATQLTWTEAGWVIQKLQAMTEAALPDPEPEPAPEPETAAPVEAAPLERLYRGARMRGFTDEQVKEGLEQEYAQPVEDLTDDQIVQYTTRLALGTAKLPEARA